MKRLNLTKSQLSAIKFIAELGYISSVNHAPINIHSLKILFEIGLIKFHKNKIDFILTSHGKNIALGL